MIKRIFAISVMLQLLSFNTELFAQNPGYMGKRFMVKMNLVNGARPLYFGGEVEYTLHKRLMVGIGAGWQTSMYRQLYFAQPSSSSSITRYYTHDQTRINSTWVYAQLKYFFPGGLMNAPQGLYLGLKAGAGSADIYSETGKAILITQSYPYETFEVKGIPFGSYQVGLGYQRIVAKRLVLDASAYFDFFTFNSTGNDSNIPYTSTLATEFGPNTLWPFDEYRYRSSIVTNYGVSLYFKMGILIF